MMHVEYITYTNNFNLNMLCRLGYLSGDMIRYIPGPQDDPVP